MKLITRFVIIYLIITVIVLGISGFISFHVIKSEIDKELKWEFLERVDRVTFLLERGRELSKKRGGPVDGDRNLTIEKLDFYQEDRTEISDTLIWNERLEQQESNVKVTAYRNIGDESYFISTYGAMIESDDITEAVVKILLWILALQTLAAIGIGFIVPGRLFRPFRQTLHKIHSFKLQEKKLIPSVKTGIREFDDLNLFVEKMTKKAVTDYKNLKEFAENASHELQTPLAIARGKLELLSETPLNEEQFQYVNSIEKSIKKLSRLSGSLALLTKIETHEFDTSEPVNLSELIKSTLKHFEEFITLNKLTVHSDIQPDTYIHMHPVLADILWTNLLQNAIKHSTGDGHIRIQLTPEKLTLSNTGPEPSENPEHFFERFKKGDQTADSIGLGLSIIKQITDQNNYLISYTYKDGIHTIEVLLKSVKE